MRSVLVCAVLGVCGALEAANPFLPAWEFIPDGEPYVFEDPDRPGHERVYLYGSHDNTMTSYCGRDQVVWSAPVEDLSKWRFDGVIFRSLLDRDGRRLDKEGLGDFLFAPDVAMTTDAAGKKTYWLFPNNMGEGRHGMAAKAERPDGPFVVSNWSADDPTRTTGVFDFDPAVFVDDDGRVYGYWGFEHSFAAELDPATMSTVKSGTAVVTNLVSGSNDAGVFRFYEASSMRKIKDKYVLIYSRSENRKVQRTRQCCGVHTVSTHLELLAVELHHCSLQRVLDTTIHRHSRQQLLPCFSIRNLLQLDVLVSHPDSRVFCQSNLNRLLKRNIQYFLCLHRSEKARSKD